MSEKFLGYYAVGGKAGKKKVIVKKPVRLASESVDLKWLREEIERFYFNNPEMEGANMALKHLFLMAEKEAKKKVSKNE